MLYHITWFLMINIIAKASHIHTKIEKTMFYLSQNLHNDSLHKKLSFPLRICLVNVAKSEANCRFGHIY